jgi:WD40 repeat protein
LKRIEEWEADYMATAVYWLNGISGSGKSTIAQTFAERSAKNGRLGGSFFCSRDFPDRRNIHLIFPTLAYHLAHRYPEFRAELIQIIKENPDVCSDSLEVQVKNLIILPLQLARIRTTIVIDALDECEDNLGQPASAILSLLARHIEEIPLVKFFITGRPEQPIRSGFRLPLLRPHTEVFLLHNVDRASVDQDIKLYMKTLLTEMVRKRSHCNLTIPWPGDGEIEVTMKRCSGHFIVASIIVKFVSSSDHDPEEQLKIILDSPDSTVHEGRLGIDAMYDTVLLQSFKELIGTDESEFYIKLRLVIGSIVVVFNPLSCSSLEGILGMKAGRVGTALRRLHSIFIVPESEVDPIRICHKSLADYLQDENRCKDSRFYINPSVLHLELGLRCLRLMNNSLKRNICEIPRYAMNADISDLDARRERYIGSGLEYGCRSWAKHLRLGSMDRDNVRLVVQSLKEFFHGHLLQWLEVLSIVGDVRYAVYSLQDVVVWLVDVSTSLMFLSCLFSLSAEMQAKVSDASLLAIVKDCERFILRFFDVMELSATHIYESALPLSPSSSLVRALYQDQVSMDVRFCVIEDVWDACIRTIRPQSKAICVAFSHRDDLIAVGEGHVVEIFEAATGRRRATLTTNYNVHALTFSPDDNILVTGSGDQIHVWDLQTGGLVGSVEEHVHHLHSIIFSPCGNMFTTRSTMDDISRIWNTFSLDYQGVLEGHSGHVRAICWLASGIQVITQSSDDIAATVWSVSNAYRCSPRLTILTGGEVESVAFSPEFSLIAAACPDEKVKVFDAETGDLLHTIPTSCGFVDSIRFFNQVRILCIAHNGGYGIFDITKSAGVFRSESRRLEGQLGGEMSSDGFRLASCSILGDVVNIFQTDTQIQNQSDISRHHTNRVWCITFSRDGQLVASGSMDHTVKIWDTSTGECLTTFRDHRSWVLVVVFSPDSTLCASWEYDGVIRVWNTRTGNPVSAFEYLSVFRLHFFSDDSQLVSQSESSLQLWDIATGDCLASTQIKSHHTDISLDVDGINIILRSANGEIQRWTLAHNPNEFNDSNHYSETLPMVFVLAQDTEPHTLSDASPRQYYLDEQGSWVLDNQNRRRLSMSHSDMTRSDFHGGKVALGSANGIVTIVDFSNVSTVQFSFSMVVLMRCIP